MVKYKQGEIYSLQEIIEDGKPSRWAEFNLSRYLPTYPVAMYLGVKKGGSKTWAIFGLLTSDKRPGRVIAAHRFKPDLHENIPADLNLHKKFQEERKKQIKKLMETPEYKYMTRKFGEDISRPETLEDPEMRRAIYDALKKGDIKKFEQLKREALNKKKSPEPSPKPAPTPKPSPKLVSKPETTADITPEPVPEKDTPAKPDKTGKTNTLPSSITKSNIIKAAAAAGGAFFLLKILLK